MAFEFLQIPKRLYKFYRPYFGRQGKKLKRTLCLAALVVGNILYAVLASFFSSAVNSMIIALEEPDVTYGTFFGTLSPVGWYLGLQLLVIKVNIIFLNFLRGSLTTAVDETIAQKWTNGNAFYGIKYLKDKRKEIDPAQIFTTDSSELIASASRLGNELLSVICQFGAGIVGLYILSWPMIFGSLLYAWGYNVISGHISKDLPNQEHALKRAEADLHYKSQYISEHAESIAFLKGAEYEYQGLRASLNAKKIIKEITNTIRLSLFYITQLHYEITYLIPILLSVPAIISKKLKLHAVWEITPSFTWIVSLFTWKNENFDDITNCSVALTRIEAFQDLLDVYEKTLKESNQITVTSSVIEDTKVKLENITLRNPNGKPLLTNINIDLPKGRATLLQGESGCGKTTLLRALANLWPYMQKGGTMVLPKGAIKVVFIPRDGFVFHQGNTLLQAMMYPAKDAVKFDTIAEIKILMEKSALKFDIIADLEKVDNWDTRLSGGEKQRIALISAMIKRPHVLLMDEATANIDPTNKNNMEALIKAELPNTAIGYTDHNPTETATNGASVVKTYTPLKDNFRDFTILLDKGTATISPPYSPMASPAA